ncbi:hypothetical protein AG1IA_09119 [Rhizoctonia solani AG-1 IA]|uniref:Uncharacterized protein n=1 Tax=Thanatephorus cucumeris (strain AG1-IA) TaxID=983506 RepID=L8WFA6_THACA|nr:hypothetical protein AG1IA_09119 [Rhizoctonia solani AG-1 IA]
MSVKITRCRCWMSFFNRKLSSFIYTPNQPHNEQHSARLLTVPRALYTLQAYLHFLPQYDQGIGRRRARFQFNYLVPNKEGVSPNETRG